MKISSVFFFLLIQFTFRLHAQSDVPQKNEAKHTEIGINGGIHKSGFYQPGSLNPFGEYIPYWSYTASVYYKTPTTKNLYAGCELEQVNIKSNLHFSKPYGYRTGYVYDALINLDYLNLHLLFGGKLFSIKKLTISGTLSPYFGYLLQSKAKGYEATINSYNWTDSLGMHSGEKVNQQLISGSQTKKFRKINTGLCLNLDLAIPFAKRFILTGRASYDLGIYNVVTEDSFIGIRGYAFSMGLAYMLNKKDPGFNGHE